MQVWLSAWPECFGFKQDFFGSEYGQEHNKLRQLARSQSASQPVEYLKPSQWICGYENLHIFLF